MLCIAFAVTSLFSYITFAIGKLVYTLDSRRTRAKLSKVFGMPVVYTCL